MWVNRKSYILLQMHEAMKDDGYKIRDQYAVHFITFAVVEWIDVFTRRARLSVVFRRTTTELNENPDCVWYL